MNTLGSNRAPLLELDEVQRQALIADHCLVTDQRRTRPRWFDGRFLAARDLSNEQNYFLLRQADLGRAGGTGVIEGLTVSPLDHATTGSGLLRISPGYGFTDTGEMVVLDEALDLDVTNIPEQQRLDVAFGLQVIPNESGRTRTGLYVLALRSVEWTANPTAAYPTSLTGERTVQDGNIIGGVAVSLLPYPDNGSDGWARRRARVAREIFVGGRDRGITSGTLPLAVVALTGNQIVWVDPYLARRDAGAERPAGMDFGFGNRSLREAQLLQYEHHLADVLNTTQDQPFEAAAWFDALPPVGRLPAQSVDADTMTHLFFPPALTVELAFVADDELPAIIEESLLLPPLDLLAPAETLAGLGVMILAPLSRADFAPWYSKLGGRTLKLSSPVRELKGNPRLLTFSLNYLRDSGLADLPVAEAVNVANDDWKNLLRKAQDGRLLWFVRRRHLPEEANVAGAAVDATDPAKVNRGALQRLIAQDTAFAKQLSTLRARNIPEINALLTRFAEHRLVAQPALLKTLAQAATADPALSTEGVIAALAPAANPDFGNGLATVTNSDPTLEKALAQEAVVSAGVLREVDSIARAVPAGKRAEFVRELKDAASNSSTLAASVAALRTKFLLPSP
jgi:hypothetical protein